MSVMNGSGPVASVLRFWPIIVAALVLAAAWGAFGNRLDAHDKRIDQHEERIQQTEKVLNRLDERSEQVHRTLNDINRRLWGSP